MRIAYLLFLTLSAGILVFTVFSVTALILQIDENAGNGGAFAASGLMIVGGVGVFLSMFLALASGSVAYVFGDDLPPKRLYWLRWSLALATPGLLVTLAMLKEVLVDAL